ncbi:hypothetical protein CXIVA_10420 [Clostridium sp. SY8519]|uniref:hypothetical protein n=1 Tax=Clostridium sp. (strain SY8519) TaxID=1042156 RepID=UPI0002171B40|nr:hypothetical protein [Clostridium sp. SY8519]BAK47009.1 hypothetical protein CXIVA_10420 [Clostridium sp. SY8519]
MYYNNENKNFKNVRKTIMVYDYIMNNYENGDPIFLSDLPGNSRDYLRQEMKKLVDDGKLERLYNGVYYLSYLTILGTKGHISIDKYLDKKYLCINGKVSGYITGLMLANTYGFTTQNPACYEICSNEATTKQRKRKIDGNTIIVYKPVTEVTEKNKSALQFLDLMSTIDKYSEVSGAELSAKIKKFADTEKVDFSLVQKYLPLYPDKVYRNIYNGGLMGELV